MVDQRELHPPTGVLKKKRNLESYSVPPVLFSRMTELEVIDQIDDNSSDSENTLFPDTPNLIWDFAYGISHSVRLTACASPFLCSVADLNAGFLTFMTVRPCFRRMLSVA